MSSICKRHGTEVGRCAEGHHDILDDLPVILNCLARYSNRGELLAVRALSRQSPPFLALGIVNIEAALLAVQSVNRSMRSNLDFVERCICHHLSFWRKGFARQRDQSREAAFWIRRAISRVIAEELPMELERLIARFCSNYCFKQVALSLRQLSQLNSLAFHWHRSFSQGPSGPQRAVNLASRTLTSSGALILRVAAGMRTKLESACDLEGHDITKRIYSEAQVVHRAMHMLVEIRRCMAAHPCMFGKPLQDAVAADKAQKEENDEEEARFARWRELGYYVDENELDART